MSAENAAAEAPVQEGFRVYVGNLPYSATEEEVRNLLKPAGGELLSVALPLKFNKRPAGYAFAAYKTEEDAKKAVEQVTGQELGERKLVLELARSKEEAAEARKARRSERSEAKGGETTAAEGEATEGEAKPKKKRSSKKREPRRRRPEEGDELEQPAEATGITTDPSATAAIANEVIKPKRKPRKPKAAKDARIDATEGDETLVESKAEEGKEKRERKPRQKREPRMQLSGEASKSTIFVANLPFSVNDEELAAIFTNLSIAVKSAKVVMGMRRGRPGSKPTSSSKGFGFVEVENPAQQQEAVDKVEGSLIGDRKISAKIANEMKPVEKEQAAEAQAEAKETTA